MSGRSNPYSFYDGSNTKACDGKIYSFAEQTIMRRELPLHDKRGDTSWFTFQQFGLPFTGTYLYRLRCLKLPVDCAHERAAESLWPPNLTVYVNGNLCKPTKLPGNRRCAPIDVSTFLDSYLNKLKVVLPTVPKAVDRATYAFVIDAVRCVSHDHILRNIKLRTYTLALQQVVQPLNQLRSSDDDELTIVSTTRTISLVEPHSNVQLIERPVRSKLCTHVECFDLETYLAQQPSHDGRWPARVDGWECPICKGPAAPHQLIEDGFLLKVLRRLKVGSFPHGAKAIEVRADATWDWKRVEQPDVERLGQNSRSSAQCSHEVIELD